MKKLCMLSVLVLCILLTGCGEKKLICKYSSSDSYRGSDTILAKYVFKKNGKIDKYIINEKVVFNDSYLKASGSSIDSQYEGAKQYCDSMVPDTKNIKCSVTKNGDAISVILEYNISKMSDEEIQELGLTDYLSSKKDDVKKQYEEQGFTCK